MGVGFTAICMCFSNTWFDIVLFWSSGFEVKSGLIYVFIVMMFVVFLRCLGKHMKETIAEGVIAAAVRQYDFFSSAAHAVSHVLPQQMSFRPMTDPWTGQWRCLLSR